MTIDANTIWEIRTGGSVDNGGGFVVGASGTDYSQQDSPQYALTGCTSSGVSATAANANAAAVMVGNTAKVVSGTNAVVGWYEIVSVSVGVSITFDRGWTTGSATSGVINVGGATWWTDAFFEGLTSGNRVYAKGGSTHTLTETIAVAKDGATTAPITIEGYTTTRGDALSDASKRCVVDAAAYAFSFDNFWGLYGLDVTGTGTNVGTFDQESTMLNCKFSNTSGSAGRLAFAADRRGYLAFSEFTSTNGTGVETASTINTFAYCYFHDCDAADTGENGLYIAGDETNLSHCVFDTCGQGVSIANVEQIHLDHLTVYNCTRGISWAGTQYSCSVSYALIDSCTTGIYAATESIKSIECRYYHINFNGNTADKSANVNDSFHDETSYDPQFVDAAGGDFETGSNADVTITFGSGTSSTSKNGAVQNSGGGGGVAGGVASLTKVGGGLVG